MISHGAVPRATGASSAVVLHIAVFVENAVVVGLLECVPHATFVVPAGLDAVLEVSDIEGVYEVALTLECPMTFAGRAQLLATDAIRTYDLVWIS